MSNSNLLKYQLASFNGNPYSWMDYKINPEDTPSDINGFVPVYFKDEYIGDISDMESKIEDDKIVMELKFKPIKTIKYIEIKDLLIE